MERMRGCVENDRCGTWHETVPDLGFRHARRGRRADSFRREQWRQRHGRRFLDVQRLHPEAVAALALCDTKAAADSEKMRAKRIAIAEECESTGTHEPVMGFAAATPEDSTIKQSDAYREQFTAWINEQPAEGIAWRERMAAGRPDLNDVLSTITAPVAVICGDKDPSSPPSVMAPIADAMTATSTDMTVVFDCGHFSAYEHPQAVADALLALVRRVQ